MGKIIDIDARQKEREKQGISETLMILQNTIDRVKEGITVGVVICEVSDGTAHFHSGAGRCCSHTMLGLLTATSLDIADRLNDRMEDVTDEDDAG